MKPFIKFCGNIPSLCFNSSFLLEKSTDFKAATYFSVCFLKAFPKGEYWNLAYSIICFWLEGNISSHVKHSHLSIFPDDNADIFAAFLLTSFSSLILSLIVIIRFYILSKRFFLKRKRLWDARVASITKKEYGFTVHFLYRLIMSLTLISMND